MTEQHTPTIAIYESGRAPRIATLDEIDRLREALAYILDLADENAKGQDGYEQIAEWSRAALAKATS